MFVRPFLATLVVAAVVGSSASAQVVPTDVVSKTVFIGDLNLADQTGARIALQRIQVAAATVCGEQPDVRLLERSARYRTCVHGAVDRAVASLDAPIMTGLRQPHGVGVLASDR